MEKFREHEKEYKQKKLTKSAMQHQHENEGKFKFDSADDDDGYDDEEESQGSSDADEYGYSSGEGGNIEQDKDWLQKFLSEQLKAVISRYEGELETMRNKKKGGAKKNKEKINNITKNLNHTKHIRERAEEL